MKTVNKLKGIVLLFLILFLTSCTEQINSKNEVSTLTATWSWVSSSGGIAGTTINPTTTGKSIKLKISSDGNYTIYTNEKITSQGTYKLEIKKCIHDHTDKNIIVFSNDSSMMIEKIDYINLFLSDEFYDGFTSTYIRQ